VAVGSWEKAKGVIGISVVLSVIWAGDMAASIPGRIAAIETNQMLLLYRMDQLEKAVVSNSRLSGVTALAPVGSTPSHLQAVQTGAPSGVLTHRGTAEGQAPPLVAIPLPGHPGAPQCVGLGLATCASNECCKSTSRAAARPRIAYGLYQGGYRQSGNY